MPKNSALSPSRYEDNLFEALAIILSALHRVGYFGTSMTTFIKRIAWLTGAHFFLSAALSFVLLLDSLGCCSGPLLTGIPGKVFAVIVNIVDIPLASFIGTPFWFSPSLVGLYLVWSMTVGIIGAWLWTRLEQFKRNKSHGSA